MKLSLLSVVMGSVGGILLYSGIKAYDPRDVLKWGLGGKQPESFLPKTPPPVTMGPNNEHPDPGQRHPGDTGYEKPGIPAVWV